jgi:predicted nucleic acid-binding Zn ribbon protein
MSRSRKPVALSSLIDGVVDRLGVGGRIKEARVEETWTQLAGPGIARVTSRVRLHGNKLVVQLTSSAWRNELHLQRGAWRDRINEALGSEVVKEIVFR